MSQQEFEPQQNERPLNNQENEARPYYWSMKPNSGNMPKNEHPSTFEDSIADMPPVPPYSYPAQDKASQTQQQYATHTTSHQQRRQRQRFSPDGDSMEYGYRPYAAYNMQVPPWARPQRNKMPVGRVILFVVLAVLLAKPLLFLLSGLIIFAGVLFTIGLVILSVIAVAVLLVLGSLGISPRRIFRSRNRWQRWRGSI